MKRRTWNILKVSLAVAVVVFAWRIDTFFANSRTDRVAWIPRDQLAVSGCCRSNPEVKTQVESQWIRIETQLRKLRPEFLKHLNPPATDEQIAALENELGFPLPYDLKCSLEIHNGGDAGLFYHLYSTDEILKRYHEASDFAYENSYLVAANIPQLRTGISVMWQPDSVPVGECTNMFDLWIELASGEVSHWFEGYEATSHTSFTHWLVETAVALETGKYETDKDGRFMSVMWEGD